MSCIVKYLPEHFRSESLHELLKILIENTGVESVKQIVRILLILHKQLQVLEDPLLDGDQVVVTD